jgi:hypothetical protein
MAAPEFWNDQNKAKAVIAEVNEHKGKINPLRAL